MAQSLIDSFGVGRDLVALVGAGGKTSLAFSMAHELHRAGTKVLVTTTTRMGAGQTGGLPVVDAIEKEVAFSLAMDGACLAVGQERDGKVAGVESDWVDEMWSKGIAEAVLVEADGARQRRVKAPADHEPVIPSAASIVIAVIAANGLDRIIGDAAHRPLRVAAAIGCRPYERLTPERAALLMTSPRGGRKAVPATARFTVAITKSDGRDRGRAERLAELLAPTPAVLVPELPPA